MFVQVYSPGRPGQHPNCIVIFCERVSQVILKIHDLEENHDIPSQQDNKPNFMNLNMLTALPEDI